MRCEPASATYRTPFASMAKPSGTLISIGAPSVARTIVETAPVGEIFRIRLLPVSDTYRLPLASPAREVGRLNRAPEPWPSTAPAGPAPAKAETAPVRLI